MQQAAGIAVLTTTALIVFFDWIPTPLNRNIQTTSLRERLPSTLVHSAIGLVLFICCAPGFPPYTCLAVAVWYGLMLASAIRNWWIPYFVGRYPGEITAASYTREYARNLTILPRRAGYPVTPDLQHSLIHLAVLAAMVSAVAAALFG